jgi:hypothetical protein
MPAPRTWADTGSAVAQVDLRWLAAVAGLVVLLRPAVGAELADLQRLVEEAGRLGFQRSAEEAGLAGFVTAAENWTHPSPRCLLEKVFD